MTQEQDNVTIIGFDADGDKVARYTDGDWHMNYPLTPCCGASGKGADTETGVCCRKCYGTVDGKYGGVLEDDEVFDESGNVVA